MKISRTIPNPYILETNIESAPIDQLINDILKQENDELAQDNCLSRTSAKSESASKFLELQDRKTNSVYPVEVSDK